MVTGKTSQDRQAAISGALCSTASNGVARGSARVALGSPEPALQGKSATASSAPHTGPSRSAQWLTSKLSKFGDRMRSRQASANEPSARTAPARVGASMQRGARPVTPPEDSYGFHIDGLSVSCAAAIESAPADVRAAWCQTARASRARCAPKSCGDYDSATSAYAPLYTDRLREYFDEVRRPRPSGAPTAPYVLVLNAGLWWLTERTPWAKVVAVARAIAECVNREWADGASVVWRESWGIHEYVVYETGLGVHGGPRYAGWEANWQRSRGRYLADGNLACISDSRVALLRSLILSEVHLATGGRVQVSPGYWMSRAWIKGWQALPLAPDMEMADLQPSFRAVVQGKPEGYTDHLVTTHDMRHHSPAVNVMGILTLLQGWSASTTPPPFYPVPVTRVFHNESSSVLDTGRRPETKSVEVLL